MAYGNSFEDLYFVNGSYSSNLCTMYKMNKNGITKIDISVLFNIPYSTLNKWWYVIRREYILRTSNIAEKELYKNVLL